MLDWFFCSHYSLFPLQLPQHGFNGFYPRVHCFHHRANAQFFRPGEAVVFVVLQQQNNFGRVDVVVFAEGDGERFGGGVDGVYAHFFGR